MIVSDFYLAFTRRRRHLILFLCVPLLICLVEKSAPIRLFTGARSSSDKLMNLHRYWFPLVAVIVAYGAVLAIPMVIDFLFDTQLEIFVILWLNVGVMVMRLRKIDFPIPASNKIDVRGGLNTLWWALFWPRYLFNK